MYPWLFGLLSTLNLTIISIGLQRDVPQYMAMPWFITWVIARTVSASKNTQKFSKHSFSFCMMLYKAYCTVCVSKLRFEWFVLMRTTSIHNEAHLNDINVKDHKNLFFFFFWCATCYRGTWNEPGAINQRWQAYLYQFNSLNHTQSVFTSLTNSLQFM